MRSDDLSPGTVLRGQYTIVRKVGQGGMGSVYEARPANSEMSVAVKCVPVAIGIIDLRPAFEQEAELLSRLDHSSLPKVHNAFTEGVHQYLVMDFIPGTSLASVVEQRGQLRPSHVLIIALLLLECLDYLHSQDPAVIHRDIKPENVHVHGDHLYLLDFGISKDLTVGTRLQGHSKHYSSPEQELHSGTDARSDLYSLGATLYYLFTGVAPPDALSRAASIQLGTPDPLRSIGEFNPDLDRGDYHALVHHALELDPSRRFKSAKHMGAWLDFVMSREDDFTLMLGRTWMPTLKEILQAPVR